MKNRKAKKLPVAFTEEEFKLLIQHTKQLHHRVGYLLGFESGLRISEFVRLKPEDVNIKEKKILVRQGKGKKDRVVPLPKRFRESYLKVLPIINKYSNLRSCIRTIQLSFNLSCQRAGLLTKKPELHPHSLRHGFATRLVSQGVPIHHIRTLMGHSNISTTNVYLEANPKEALKSYEELF